MVANWFKLFHCGCLIGELAIAIFPFGRNNVINRLTQLVVVEPGHPFQHCQSQRLLGIPVYSAVDQFGLPHIVNEQQANLSGGGKSGDYQNSLSR